MITRNWRLQATAAGALVVALAQPALAQKPITNPPVASILTWTQKQQLERYPAIEKVYAVDTIRKGDKIRALPAAATQIDPKVTFNKRAATLDAFMKDNRITGLIALKDGEVVLEKYALGRKPEDRWTSFSVAKSMTAVLMGAAIKDGWIKNVHEPVTRYLPELKGSAYDSVSIRQLISMQTGVKWDENYASQQSDVARASTAPFEGGHPVENNPLLQYMAKLPKKTEPGQEWVYKTGETDLAGMVLVRALAGKSLAQYASEKVWAPLRPVSRAVLPRVSASPASASSAALLLSASRRRFPLASILRVWEATAWTFCSNEVASVLRGFWEASMRVMVSLKLQEDTLGGAALVGLSPTSGATSPDRMDRTPLWRMGNSSSPSLTSTVTFDPGARDGMKKSIAVCEVFEQ
jgi:CubicO group peptidase (beta-lactamase class C family)